MAARLWLGFQRFSPAILTIGSPAQRVRVVSISERAIVVVEFLENSPAKIIPSAGWSLVLRSLEEAKEPESVSGLKEK